MFSTQFFCKLCLVLLFSILQEDWLNHYLQQDKLKGKGRMILVWAVLQFYGKFSSVQFRNSKLVYMVNKMLATHAHHKVFESNLIASFLSCSLGPPWNRTQTISIHWSLPKNKKRKKEKSSVLYTTTCSLYD